MKTQSKILSGFLAATIALACVMFSGCNTVRVEIPSGAEMSGTINVEVNPAAWKSNAASGENADGRVDAVTTPRTDTSLTGL